MTRTRLLLGGLVTAAVAAASLLGGVFSESPAAGPLAAAAPAVAAERALSGFAAGDTAGTISRLEEEVREGADARSLTLLGLAYQQRARETADSSYLVRSQGALRKALRLSPRDPLVVSGLASLALSRHDFRSALALARRARALAPDTARTHGLVGDALVELGRYGTAFRAFDTMVSLKPSLAAYARVSYARELLGRPRQAIEAMELALSAAGGLREPTAWTHVELGKLHFGLGELGPAERHFRAALAAFPGYVYALDGLARVEAARGRLERAIALQRRAADAVPLPQLVGQLADLLRLDGREREARGQLRLVGAIERLLAANGVRTDLESALIDVDHGIRLRDALARARAAHAQRPSVQADDVLAWALARNGRCGEALAYSKRALRLGTKDALFFFHRGEIERCRGNRAEARRWFRRALDTNPHFSLLWSPVAQRAAA